MEKKRAGVSEDAFLAWHGRNIPSVPVRNAQEGGGWAGGAQGTGPAWEG